jgi:hypothetical protein
VTRVLCSVTRKLRCLSSEDESGLDKDITAIVQMLAVLCRSLKAPKARVSRNPARETRNTKPTMEVGIQWVS